MPGDARWICEVTGATRVIGQRRIQSLWGGYGELLRVHLEGGSHPSVILKVISPPAQARGSFSHKRKVRSYEIEQAWYEGWSHRLDPARCRVPEPLGVMAGHDQRCLLLEDLDARGFGGRRGPIEPCLVWLARFHAAFIGQAPTNLWPTGTYWHLETRPEELAAIRRRALREAAEAIDLRLARARYKTLVHGDAKLANFCFGSDEVAAVDFQYVGGGCGMKDVAYLLSCLDEQTLARRSESLLELYFEHLRAARPDMSDLALDALEREWRALYPWAWADYMRFLAGWSPAYYQSSPFGQKMLRKVLKQL